MKRYALLVAYDGTRYCGWQTQKNAISVQQVLEQAAKSVFGKDTAIVASGRTDSGVHAAGQVCHFDAETTIPPEKIADALNAFLPEDISVLQSAAAPAGFNALKSAKKKTYVYNVYFSKRRNPLNERYAVWIKDGFDRDKLRDICSVFVGEHDFKAYCKSGSQVKTTVRTVYSLDVKFKEDADEFSVCGSGFLYNMVRTIIGTALYYAYGVLKYEDVLRSLKEGDRNLVGKTMPAKGLTLKSVEYAAELFG